MLALAPCVLLSQVKFHDLFLHYDADRSGRLEPRELGRLVGDLLGPQQATDSDVAYFVCMLDLDGSRSVTEQVRGHACAPWLFS